jgi:hypothetical protein
MVIASRSIAFQTANGSVNVPIRLHSPVETKEDAWTCRYEIDWPDGQWSMEAAGHDAVQAIVLALQMIGSELYTSDYHKSGKLIWERGGAGYGFPVPINLRDLMQGDDAEFF